MTTICWTPKCFASDSCLTQETDDGHHALNRTSLRKMKWRKSYSTRPLNGCVLAVASCGDGVAGEALDDQLLESAWRSLKQGACGLADQLNKKELIAERREIMSDASKVEALMVWMVPNCGDSVYYIDGTGRLKYLSERYIALGIDSGVALGAMAAGVDAVRAVEIAAQHGCYTALPIDYLRQDAAGNIQFETREFKCK